MSLSGSLFRKLLLSAIALVAITIVAFDYAITKYLGNQNEARVEERLRIEAQILAAELNRVQPRQTTNWTTTASHLANARVTLMDRQGHVLADSEHDASTMENHAEREEMKAALAGKTGSAIRRSATLNRDSVYVAVPISSQPAAVLRLSVPLEEVTRLTHDLRMEMLRISAIVFALILALSFLLSRRFAQRVATLQHFAETILDRRTSDPIRTDSLDELGSLGRSLNQMSEQFTDALNRRDHEVNQRETILSGMVEGVLAVDSGLRVTFCNRSFARMIGVPYPVQGTPLVLSLVREPSLVEILVAVVSSKTGRQSRVPMSLPEPRAYMVHAVPFGDTVNPGALAILHDITELERLERVRRDFVANVSHELRTPLAAIQGYAETLLDGGLEDKENSRRFLETIRSNTARLNDIASDLLTLSELQSGPPQESEPVSIKGAIEAALRTAAPEAAARQVALHSAEIPDRFILGSKLRLEQAFVNLLINAIKFNHEGGSVEISAVETELDWIEIRIADTGIGIPAHDLPRVFERFYRVDRARSRAVGGTGLGLSIVKNAVEGMGGKVSAESQVGKGSIFKVLLPITAS
jgi:two-component system phosphate regulon sensor histidine kinase PhoR